MSADDDINEDMPSSERIPSVLMKKLLGKGHVLYIDNYYTSPTLVKYFLSNNTRGTIHSNQYNFPKYIISEVLEYKGQFFITTRTLCKLLVNIGLSRARHLVYKKCCTCCPLAINCQWNLEIIKTMSKNWFASNLTTPLWERWTMWTINYRVCKFYERPKSGKSALRLLSQAILNTNKVFVNHHQQNSIFLKSMQNQNHSCSLLHQNYTKKNGPRWHHTPTDWKVLPCHKTICWRCKRQESFKNLQGMLCTKHQNKERSTSKDCLHLQTMPIWAWTSYWWLSWDLPYCFRLLTVNSVTFFQCVCY